MRAITLALLVTVATHALPAQGKPTIVGTWRRVSAVSTDSGGKQVQTIGDHPLGRISYSVDGFMAAQLYRTDRPKLGADPAKADPAAVRAAFMGLFTYYGRYTIDAAAHTVTHHVEGSGNPDWVGGTLVRSFRFLSDNRVQLTTVTSYDGKKVASPTVLVWERVGK